MSLSDSLEGLPTDSWRLEAGFSRDLAESQERILALGDPDVIATELNNWLQRSQPCLFGRLAAKNNAITYCVLTDSHLRRSDVDIRDYIQERRLHWSRKAYRGNTSAFVVYAVAPQIAMAVPGPEMAAFARRLAFLYLRREVSLDEMAYDEVTLEVEGDDRVTWRWFTGVNYFSAAGDGRWWHDHRIPGGMALSVNSVGHLVKSGQLKEGFDALSEIAFGQSHEEGRHRITTLPEALSFAMRTISMAADTVSGKATWLLSSGQSPASAKCPVKLPKFLEGKNFCEYQGAYHTDITLPTEYFDPSVARPSGLQTHTLDFTYLFDAAVDNPDFETMGDGIRVRGDQHSAGASVTKRRQAQPGLVRIADTELLRIALGDVTR